MSEYGPLTSSNYKNKTSYLDAIYDLDFSDFACDGVLVRVFAGISE
jgi:hypothetical protein